MSDDLSLFGNKGPQLDSPRDWLAAAFSAAGKAAQRSWQVTSGFGFFGRVIGTTKVAVRAFSMTFQAARDGAELQRETSQTSKLSTSIFGLEDVATTLRQAQKLKFRGDTPKVRSIEEGRGWFGVVKEVEGQPTADGTYTAKNTLDLSKPLPGKVYDMTTRKPLVQKIESPEKENGPDIVSSASAARPSANLSAPGIREFPSAGSHTIDLESTGTENSRPNMF